MKLKVTISKVSTFDFKFHFQVSKKDLNASRRTINLIFFHYLPYSEIITNKFNYLENQKRCDDVCNCCINYRLCMEGKNVAYKRANQSSCYRNEVTNRIANTTTLSKITMKQKTQKKILLIKTLLVGLVDAFLKSKLLLVRFQSSSVNSI